MSLKDNVIRVQNYFEEVMKKHRYNKANNARQAAVEERLDYTNCAGKLNQCLSQFKITIKTQVMHIREGEMFQRDTTLQEDELWDAAIGYMLVQDAQYAMKSLYSINSVEYAYSLLNGVTNYMNGGRLNMPLVNGVRTSSDRNAHGYLTSEKAIRDKEALLKSFYDELKRTGDIDGCLARAKNPAVQEGGRRHGRSSGTGGNSQSYRDRLDAIPGEENVELLEMTDIDNVDIDVPTAAAPQVSVPEKPVFQSDAMRAQMEDLEDLAMTEES